MKTMKHSMLLAVLAVGLCSDLLAEGIKTYPQVALCVPGGSREPVDKSKFVILVVEPTGLSYEESSIPESGVVDYVNQLLKEKNVSYIGLHAREGTRFKDLVHAVDLLCKTRATNIGISVKELPVGG